jgi:hypothetical protein
MPKSSFTDIFKSTLTNAGYFCGVSIHAIQRQLGKGVDSKFICACWHGLPRRRRRLARLPDLLALPTQPFVFLR